MPLCQCQSFIKKILPKYLRGVANLNVFIARLVFFQFNAKQKIDFVWPKLSYSDKSPLKKKHHQTFVVYLFRGMEIFMFCMQKVFVTQFKYSLIIWKIKLKCSLQLFVHQYGSLSRYNLVHFCASQK